MGTVIFTKRDCAEGETAVVMMPGTKLLGYIRKVRKCGQCGGACYQYQKTSGRVTHHSKLTEAKDEALKL